jgi:DUF4097 and DUF4098 domain-containing protein YvlB
MLLSPLTDVCLEEACVAMNSLLFLWVLLLFDGNPSTEIYAETSVKEFAFYPGGKLEIRSSVPGNIRITGWNKSSVRVEIQKKISASSNEEAQKLAKQYEVRVTNTVATARIDATAAAGMPAQADVLLSIFVPAQKTDLDIRALGANLAISSLNGSMEATLESGGITAENLDGYFSVLTKLGDLDIRLHRKYWTGYGFSAVTRRGNIRLRIPEDYSAALQLEATNGKITADFPEQETPLEVLAKKKSQWINGQIGSGGTPIRCATAVGEIEFSVIR